MRILFALPTALADALSTDAGRYGHQCVGSVTDAAALATASVESGADVVVALSRPDLLDQTALSACDAHGIRVVALVADDAGRRHASELGLFETVAETSSWAEVESVLDGATPRETEPQDGRGRVIAVWGPAGAPGRTATAIGLAAELAAAGHSVALADADTHGASIAPTLGLLDEAPGFAAACRLAGASALDRNEFERIGQRYGSATDGFWVLTGIGRANRWPELSPDRVRGAIEGARNWVDFTVVDTGPSLESDEEISSDLFAPRRNGATIAALKEADSVVAVGAADPVGMSRFLRAHVDLVDLVEPERITVVLNKLRASAIGLNPAGQVRQTLARFGGIDDATLVPFDGAGYDGAVLQGRALRDAAPKSPARVALQTLVRTRFAGVTSADLSRRLGVR